MLCFIGQKHSKEMMIILIGMILFVLYLQFGTKDDNNQNNQGYAS